MAIHMFQQLIDTLKKSPKRIVFTEGTDARILEASARLLAGTWLAPILIGNEAEVKAAAEEVGFNIRGAEIIDPATYPDMDKMVEEMVALRRGKMTADECRAALMKGNYFGTMLVKMGVADCLRGHGQQHCAGHGRLRHQHRPYGGRAGGDRPGVRQVRQNLRH